MYNQIDGLDKWIGFLFYNIANLCYTQRLEFSVAKKFT